MGGQRLRGSGLGGSALSFCGRCPLNEEATLNRDGILRFQEEDEEDELADDEEDDEEEDDEDE